MPISKQLRVLRKKLGLRQEDVAAKAKISAAYLSQIENGKREATPGVLSRLAEALGTSLPVLYLLTLDESDVPPERREAFNELAPAIHSFLMDTLPVNSPNSDMKTTEEGTLSSVA